MSTMVEIHKNISIDKIRNMKGLAIVYIWAEWSPQCKNISEKILNITKERSDIKIVCIEADKNKCIITDLNVRSIPSLIIFRDGMAVSAQVGPDSALKLEELLNKNSNE